MGKLKDKRGSLVDGYKRLKKKIEIEDMKTDGKFSSAIIAFLCLLSIGCFLLAFIVFK